MTVRNTLVYREYLDHDTGHWCHTCQLGTGLRIWVAVTYLARAHLQTWLWCPECKGHNVTVEHDVSPIGPDSD